MESTCGASKLSLKSGKTSRARKGCCRQEAVLTKGSRWYGSWRTQAGVPSVVKGESKAKELTLAWLYWGFRADFSTADHGLQGRENWTQSEDWRQEDPEGAWATKDRVEG